jgi:flagellar capping protein FliD
LRRRVAELDEVWNRLQSQLEQRERQLKQEFQKLEKVRSRPLSN